MLQENPKARLTMADLMGHPWVQGECATVADLKKEYYSVISDMTNYPTYSVDFDRNQAREALRGEEGEEDTFDYEKHFNFDVWKDVEIQEFDPESASRFRITVENIVPTELWELVYRMAKKKGGFVDPEMKEEPDKQYKLTFYPKP